MVAITGPAAVGKSSVAKALQAELVRDGDLWLLVELDLFARALSRDWIGVGGRSGRYAERGFTYGRGGDGSIGLVLGPDGRRVLAAFHRSVAAMLRSGVNVICETIIHDETDWRDWLEALADLRCCWVNLSAPLAVLEAREKAERAAVFQGLARGMSARAPVGQFDIEANTGEQDVSAIVRRLAATLRK
jgi:chloramphenicol 3-O phosphotransferase